MTSGQALRPTTVLMPRAGTKRLQNVAYSSPFRPLDGSHLPPVLRWLSGKALWRRSPEPNRFDDPDRRYQVTYTGTTLKDCAIEVFDRFRADALAASLAVDVRRKETETFAYPLGSIPRSEIEEKGVWDISSEESFVDLMSTSTQSWLTTRARVTGLVERYTRKSIVDSGVVLSSGAKAREITGRISSEVFAQDEHWAGMRYVSRIGSGHEGWAVYERSNPSASGPVRVTSQHPDIQAALEELGLIVV
jgi:hypothetical protein